MPEDIITTIDNLKQENKDSFNNIYDPKLRRLLNIGLKVREDNTQILNAFPLYNSVCRVMTYDLETSEQETQWIPYRSLAKLMDQQVHTLKIIKLLPIPNTIYKGYDTERFLLLITLMYAQDDLKRNIGEKLKIRDIIDHARKLLGNNPLFKLINPDFTNKDKYHIKPTLHVAYSEEDLEDITSNQPIIKLSVEEREELLRWNKNRLNNKISDFKKELPYQNIPADCIPILEVSKLIISYALGKINQRKGRYSRESEEQQTIRNSKRIFILCHAIIEDLEKNGYMPKDTSLYNYLTFIENHHMNKKNVAKGWQKVGNQVRNHLYKKGIPLESVI